MIDVRAGFSDNLAMIPYDLERVVKAGAAAIMLDDRAFGCGDDSATLTLVSQEVFAKKIALAVHAAENTNCMVLARSFTPDKACTAYKTPSTLPSRSPATRSGTL